MLTGLNQLNIELSSRCDRLHRCDFCGHQSLDVNPNLKFGDISLSLLSKIRQQIDPPIIISCHRDGDPLVHPELGQALSIFKGFPVSVVTHGEALNKRADEVIGQCTSVTVSVIPKDKDREIQLESIRGFLAKKGNKMPMVQLKFVGRIDDSEEYEKLGIPIINRALHTKKGSFNYVRIDPIVPEIRVCLDLLGSPCVSWNGDFYICNRLNIHNHGLLGNLNTHTIDELWNGDARRKILDSHLIGRRDLAGPLCASCEFYGVPTPSG